MILAVLTMSVLTGAGFVLKGAGLFEMPLSRAFNRHHHGLVGAAGEVLYRVAGPAPAVIGTLVITAAVLVTSRSVARASTFGCTVAVTWLSVAAGKLLVHRPRPDAALLPFPFHPAQLDASYPSGHAAFVTALAMTAFLMARSRRTRTAAAVLGAGAIVTAGTLLAVDGVHYPTDVAASVLWVIGAAPAVHALWTRCVLPATLPRVTAMRVATADPHPGAPVR